MDRPNILFLLSDQHSYRFLSSLTPEQGLWWKQTWHEASARVPLIISIPAHRRGEEPPAVVDEPVSLGDLFPTLCGVAGPPPDDLDGADLSSLLWGGECAALAERPGVFVENLNPHAGAGTEYRLIRSVRYKYIAFNDCDDLRIGMVSGRRFRVWPGRSRFSRRRVGGAFSGGSEAGVGMRFSRSSEWAAGPGPEK